MWPFLFIFLFAHAAQEPFWKSKEKVFERVKNGEIIVAVKSQIVHDGGPPNLMTAQGGGHVHAPAEFVYRKALEFDQLAKVSGYIRSAKYDPSTQILEIQVGAFGFDSKMKMSMKMKPSNQIEFVVLDSVMRGLAGTFTFESLAPKKTEVGINATFRYDQFPAPRIFLEFGLEVIFQRMAARLRAHVEEEYKKGNPS